MPKVSSYLYKYVYFLVSDYSLSFITLLFWEVPNSPFFFFFLWHLVLTITAGRPLTSFHHRLGRVLGHCFQLWGILTRNWSISVIGCISQSFPHQYLPFHVLSLQCDLDTPPVQWWGLLSPSRHQDRPWPGARPWKCHGLPPSSLGRLVFET